jgi:Flp pilus assembly protein TadG
MSIQSMAKASRTEIRRGAVTVEFAITAPILFLLVFAGIEFSRVNMIRNTLQNAAYEGARRGILPGSTSSECESAAEDILEFVGIRSFDIDVTPITQASADVTVTVEVPITAANGYVTPRFFLGRILRTSITLPREQG